MRRLTAHSRRFLAPAGRAVVLAGLLAHLLIPALFAGHVFAEHSGSVSGIEHRSHTPSLPDEQPEHCDLCRLLSDASVANGVSSSPAGPGVEAPEVCGVLPTETRGALASAITGLASPRAPPSSE